MTPKQSGETIVVAPTTLNPSTPAVSVLKKEEADANFEDSTLEKAERKMLNEINPEDDEEISSFDESGTPLVDTIKLENRMISVAIARSVADDEAARAAPPSDASNGQHTFRKRQRVDEESSMVPPVVKLEQIKPIVTPAQTVSVHQGQPPTVQGINQGFSQQGVNIKSGGSELTRRIASGPRVEAHKSATQPVMPRPRNATIVSKVTSSQQPLIRPLVRPTALKVPNPLANIPAALPIKPVKQESPRPPSVTNTTKSYSNRPPLVPCPLPPIPCPLPAPSSVQSSRVQPRPPVKSGTTISSRLPRTVPTQTTATPLPSMSVGPPLPQRRGRIFSIDIDCGSLEFPDMNMESIASQEFTSTDPLPPISSTTTATVRQTTPAPVPQIVQSKPMAPPVVSSDPTVTQGRDRAMSFEFFSFGINADEPLPPAADLPDAINHPVPTHPQSSSTVITRPRGDSIIFDPSSFLDGGILEEKALMKLRSPSIDLPSSDEMAIMNTPGFNPSSVLHSPAFPPAPKPPSRPIASQLPSTARHSAGTTQQQGQMATLPSALNGTMNHATFQMDLLNKDGRIGIYLPEARKARIAKFHSKRKMRIWRKRIKYDCRKKLADSRPRVKGRFVKRSEMDEEE